LTCPIHCTLYRGAQQPIPISQDDFTSWEELVVSLKDLVEVESGAPMGASREDQKKQLCAIAPHRLTRPYRLAENVGEVTFLVIDVDRCDLPALVKRVDELDIAAVIYGSPSDDESLAERRVRVLAPIDRPLRPEESQHARYAFAEMLGIGPGQGVEGAHEAAKLFFIGRLHDAPERVWVEATGRDVDVDPLMGAEISAEWSKVRNELAPTGVGDMGSVQYQRATRIAETLPASIEGMGGDLAIFKCAREIATQLHEDADAIERVLTDVFNPRCVPPWPQDKLHYEALQAAEEQASVVGRLVRRQNQRMEDMEEGQDPDANAYRSPCDSGEPDPWDSPLDFDDNEDPLVYYCEALKIAPSDGKITIIAGQPGAAKGPIANHLAICFALGIKAFGQFPCKQCRVAILDFEGARLTRRRCRRLVRGAGFEPAELRGRLFVYDANKLGDFSDDYTIGRLRAFVEAKGIDVVIVDSYMSAMMSSGVEPNSPQYATLAKALGSLGVCVIVVAHANKAAAKEDSQPRLSHIGWTAALSALAATAIMTYHPDAADKNVVEICCARAPEEGFAPILIRFSGGRDEPLRVALASAGTDAPLAAPRQSRDVKKYAEIEAKANAAADRIVWYLRNTTGAHNGATAAKIRGSAGISMADWGNGLMKAQLQGLVELVTLPSESSSVVRLTDKGGAKPQPGRYNLPVAGEVASTS